MPSKSAKQRRFMRAAANNPEFARRNDISQSVAREFVAADERSDGESGVDRAMRDQADREHPTRRT